MVMPSDDTKYYLMKGCVVALKKIFAALLILILLLPASITESYAAQPDGEGSRAQGVHLSLRAGSTHILLNGEDAELQFSPFISDGVFYVPLREIAELCGGVVKYLPEDQSVLLAFPQTMQRDAAFARLWLASGEIKLDAETTGPAAGILPVSTPIVMDGHTFVPIGYFFRFGCATPVVSEDQAILFSTGYRVGAGPFNIEDDFNALAPEVQAQFYPTGEYTVYENDTGRQEVWTNGDVDLILAVGSRYWEEGSRPILRIEVKNPGISTDWGLQVGDSAQRYYDLYLILHDFFQPEIQDGTITRLVFWSPHG